MPKKQEDELLRKLYSKTREIEALVANAYQLGDIKHLAPEALQRLKEKVQAMIDAYEEALLKGKEGEEWHALDTRLSQTEVGRLLQERDEIAEQILDLRDVEL